MNTKKLDQFAVTTFTHNNVIYFISLKEINKTFFFVKLFILILQTITMVMIRGITAVVIIYL